MMLTNLSDYKSHSTAVFIVHNHDYMTVSTERIYSLVGSLNRSPDYDAGGTIKADFFTVKSIYNGDVAIDNGYDHSLSAGNLSIPEIHERCVAAAQKAGYKMVLFVT